MVIKRYMRKCDTCVGHEAHINKLLLKKPPGIMSAVSAARLCNQDTSIALKGLEESKRGRKREKTDMQKIEKGEWTSIESGARRRIFGVWLHSMGLAQVDYPMHPADGMLHR